jgi:hypothetical protein
MTALLGSFRTGRDAQVVERHRVALRKRQRAGDDRDRRLTIRPARPLGNALYGVTN